MKKHEHSLPEPIAIIGASCRFPGRVSNLDEFWNLLENGVDAVTVMPPGRFSLERYYSANKTLAGRSYTMAAGVIEGIKDFDSAFFGMSRKEAQDMDPQQRLALECAWEALENAHIPPSRLRGTSTGVFMGASSVDNSLQAPDDPEALSPYAMTGTNLSIVANRISHILDLRGPSLTVDTACSSSLTALHLACEALRSGRVPLAIAGGVNILLAPYGFVGFSKARMLSPDGRCKVFDASGNGYVRSEGGGAVLLKPLSNALRDGDAILAVIAGSAVNSDGRTTGIALPSGQAQAALLEEVYSDFQLDKGKLVYVEAHGTGTAAGDPLEAASVGSVLGLPLKGTRPLHLGSVKSNIGHLEAASGIAGLLKAVLVLRHGKIPRNPHFETPNPAIDFEGLNIRVPRKLTSLPRAGGDELVSVNSFGFGGTNAHVVLRRAPRKRGRRLSPERGGTLPPLLLSATGIPALCSLAGTYAGLLEGKNAAEAYDLAASLAYDRDALPLRMVFQAADATALCRDLRQFARNPKSAQVNPAPESPLAPGGGVYAFSGNGSQWPGMGTALLRTDRTFRESVEEVDALLAGLQNWSLMDVFRDPDAHPEAFLHTEKSQPLLFALQVGLVRSLENRGLHPSAVAGHSLGEIAAAWACGALTLKDATTVIHYRSFLQGPLRDTGCMAVANISEPEARELLKGWPGIEISAVNTDSSLTLASADATGLAEFVETCKAKRIAAKLLDIPYPFHTATMERVREELLSSLAGIHPSEPAIPFYSTVSGHKLASSLDAAYWYDNLRKPVLFAAAIEEAFTDGFRRFLEIGPHPILRSYMRDIFTGRAEKVFVGSTLSSTADEAASLEAAWSGAWRNGWDIGLEKHFPFAHARCGLPLYPWDKEYVWFDDTPENRGFLKQERLHPLLGWALPGHAPVFENTLCPADFPWLADHRAGDNIVYPAAAFLESMLAAANTLYPGGQLELERVAIFRPLPLSDNAARQVRLLVDKEDGGLRLEARQHMSAEAWTAYARARILPVAESPADQGLSFSSPDAFGMAVSKEHLYKTARRFLLRYGPAFRTVARAWIRPEGRHPEVLTEFSEPVPESATGMLIPPTLTDGAMQSLFLLLGTRNKGETIAYLPVSFEKVVLYSPGRPGFAHARLKSVSHRSAVASFRLLDETGNTLLYLKNCRFRRALWLEHENTASRPYTVELASTSHPDQVAPLSGISPRALAKEAERTVEAAVLPAGPDTGKVHPYLLLQLASLSAIHESILTLCGTPAQGLQCGCKELLESGALAPRQEAWFNAMLERLEHGLLASRSNDRWHVRPRGDRARAEVLWRTIVGSSPAYQPEATLLAHVFSRHAAILSGLYADREDDILSPRLMLDYFTNSSLLQPYGLAARRCVESVLRAGKSGQLINILQVSQNPAALLPELLPLLAVRPCRYVVAEKNDAEVEEHLRRFGATPSLHFERFDLEEPGQEHKGKYHLVFLAWSLHGYLNSAAALDSCRELLAPGGILCVLEHSPSVFADYVFGCRPSWWSASPDEGMPVSLLQSSEYWRHSLSRAGFSEVAATGRDDDACRPAFLLLAQKAEPAATAIPPPDQALPPPSKRWLIVAGPKGSQSALLGAKLRTALDGDGESALLHADFSADAESWWREALTARSGEGKLHLVFLAGYDNRTDAAMEDMYSVQLKGAIGLAALVKTWEALRPDMRLWVISGGGLTDGMLNARPVPSQGALCGFTRVLANEWRALDARLLDLHGDAGIADAALPSLVREMLRPTDDSEVVFSQAGRYVPRLTRLKTRKGGASDPDTFAAALVCDNPGRLQSLYWSGVVRPEPKADEVCIEVKYTGLNFRDVLWATGMLPDEALENGFSGPGMGIECSGVIRSVGQQITEWKPGDQVLCFCPSGFSTHVITRASTIARKPARMSFAEAATVPVAFMTAWYAIKHLARMQPGESILIHGAAGGVGLAAIQVAAHLGLNIFATAGSPEKHDFLRQLGVRHIYSSRSLAFAGQILKQTKGAGVDAVLNSLAGEAVPAGLSVLKPFGRFLELGKRDFFADSPMRLRPFSNNISYFGIDVDQLLVYQPALAENLFRELLALFEERRLAPLPYAAYPASRCVDAFQAMQQSRHIGKLVVSMEEAGILAEPPDAPQRKLQLRGDASYLVTGGGGGLGLASAVRLARRGAKHIILLSRRGLVDEESRELVRNMQANAVRVVEVKADVADAKQLRPALQQALKSLPPLRGIIHAAAVLDDCLITSLTPERMAASFAAKALGALNLHTFSLDCPLDFFVLYSSVAAPFGNAGQAAYVAANAMLESLGAWRRARGLPAQVIGWGPIADTGMITRNPKARETLFKVLGISPTYARDALYWLEQCIASDIGDSYYFGLDWHSRADLPSLDSPRYSRLRPRGRAQRTAQGPSLEHLRALPAKEAIEQISVMLTEEVAHILRLPEDRLSGDTPLVSQGMDSLMAVELALALEQKFELSGYTVSLSENTTPLSLAASLYAFLAGNDSAATESGLEEQMVHSVEQKHGFRLSEHNRDAVLQRMKEEPHEQ